METAQIIIRKSLSPFQHFVCNIDPVLISVMTYCGLDGPGVKFREGQDFLHLFKLALRPIQPPVQYVTGLFPRGKAARA
jgi:hypothetical protein